MPSANSSVFAALGSHVHKAFIPRLHNTRQQTLSRAALHVKQSAKAPAKPSAKAAKSLPDCWKRNGARNMLQIAAVKLACLIKIHKVMR